MITPTPTRYQLSPSHSPAFARERWEGYKDLLTKADYDLLISDENAVGTLNGETKFVFLKGVYSFADEFYGALSRLEYIKSKRAAGEDALFGYYYDPRNGPPRYTNKTLEHRHFYDFHLSGYLAWLSLTVRRNLRRYWNEQRAQARKNGEFVIRGIPGRKIEKYTKQNMDYLLSVKATQAVLQYFPQDPIFSTVTINRSAPFLPHMDAKNEGGLACLMAFGEFTGGDLCLPRLRVAFRLRPGDLLIADNNREYHGNVGGIYGDRISVVAYLRSM
jgi:hypothetical protein